MLSIAIANALATALSFWYGAAPDDRVVRIDPEDLERQVAFGSDVDVACGTFIVGIQSTYDEKSATLGGGVIHIYSDSDEPTLQNTLAPSEPAIGFGKSIAVSGDFVAVGAPSYGSIDENSSAVYVYRRRNAQFDLLQTLLPEDRSKSDTFGWRVLLDGDWLFVSAPKWDDPKRSGAVFVYKFDDGSWKENDILQSTRPDERFGYGLAFENGVLAVGVPVGEGMSRVEMYRCKDEKWTLSYTIRASESDECSKNFGQVIALDDPWLAVSSIDNLSGDNCRSVSVFERDGERWVPAQRLAVPYPGDPSGFGISVAFNDGRLFVGDGMPMNPGKNRVGRVYVYSCTEQTWSLDYEILPESADQVEVGFGYWISSLDAGRVAIGSAFGTQTSGPLRVLRLNADDGELQGIRIIDRDSCQTQDLQNAPSHYGGS